MAPPVARLARIPGQLAEIARFAARKRPQERDDADVHATLLADAGTLGLAPGLTVDWLGTAGYRLAYEGRVLLVDPYISRVGLAHVLRGRPALPDLALLDRVLPPEDDVVGILVGHTHFDHAVDAPALARRHGCPVLGSRSLAHLMDLHGLAEQAVEVEPRHSYELGPFRVSFVPSRHSRLLLGLAVPSDGELTCDHLHGLTAGAYRCGDVWGIRIDVAGTSLYHQGSADLRDEELGSEPVDVFLAGVAGRSFSPGFWERILPRLDPAVVVASHYDDFLRPLDAPLGFATNVALAQVPDEVARVSAATRVATLPPPPPP